MHWPFGRDKDKAKTNSSDDLVARMGGLKLGQDSRRASSPPKGLDGFVGGFLTETRPQSDIRDDARHKPLPAMPNGAGIDFPWPKPHAHSPPPPGPLPSPPRMPVPQTSGSSMVTQFAEAMWNDGRVQATLGPPQPAVQHRPHSDSAVPTSPQSISTPRHDKLPTTPTRHDAPSQQVPATVPGNIFQSRTSPPATPTKGGRKRAASTSAVQSSSAIFSSGTVQCSGVTQKGQRCKNMVKPNPVLIAVTGDDDGSEGESEVFCNTHKGKIVEIKEFLSPVTQEWVKFSEFIPPYLDQATQVRLRRIMLMPASKADKDGFIYAFEILDDENEDIVFLKVGRTVMLNKRMDQWSNQCGSKAQHLRGRWPEMPGDDDAQHLGRLEEGRKGKFCHRLERLIHLHLADLAYHGQYLLPEFPDVNPDSLNSVNDRAKLRTPCKDCGKLHKEIFAFKRVPEGCPLHKHEWDLVVKEVIHSWGRFVEEHVVRETTK